MDTVLPCVHHRLDNIQSNTQSGSTLNDMKQETILGQLLTVLSIVGPLAGFIQHVGNYQYNPNQLVVAPTMNLVQAPAAPNQRQLRLLLPLLAPSSQLISTIL